MSLAAKGKPKSEEHKQHMKGPKSKEHIEKLRISHIGQICLNKGKIYEEIYGINAELEKKKRSNSLKGINHTKEHNLKISKSLIGIKKSKEAIEKSAKSRRKGSPEMIIDILKLKKEGISAIDTYKKYPIVSLRTIQSIRAGNWNNRINL